MPLSHYHKAKFVISVAHKKQLPNESSHEVAFVGRSNSGKSSALNALTQQTKLAKISKTPGRTQQLNFFTLTDEKFLVDLPGYGFAKINLKQHESWRRLIDDYLNNRWSLKGIVQIMDIRHPLTELDQQMIMWANNCKRPMHLVLNKSDKLSKQKCIQARQKVERFCKEHNLNYTVQIFSALKKTGIDELSNQLDQWLDLSQ